MLTPTTTPIISEEIVEDVNDAFDALVDDVDETLSDGVAEHIDNANEEFERLTAEEVNPAQDLVITGHEFMNALDEAVTSGTLTQEEITAVESVLNAVSTETTVTETPLTIPVNNLDFLIDDSHARFRGAVWFDKVHEQRATIIGQGGIGSWSSLIIGRLGVMELAAYDGDIVESVNMAGQMFGRNDIGNKKSNAIHSRVYDLCEYFYFHSYPRNFNSGDYLYPITIGALDNMEARKLIYNSWKKRYGFTSEGLFIDGRLSADEFQIFIIKAGDMARMKEYEAKWLFDQSEGDATVCSFKQTTYMATMIASFIGNAIVNYCANLTNPDLMFDLPFLINYNAEMMYLKTVDL